MSRKRWGDGPTPLSDSEDESEDPQRADLGMMTGEGQDLQKARIAATPKREAPKLQTAVTGAIAEREPESLQCIECAEGIREVRRVCWWAKILFTIKPTIWHRYQNTPETILKSGVRRGVADP